MKINPETLARASSRHPWRVVVVWVILIVAAGATAGALLGGVLNNDIEFTNEPESVRAQNVIDERFAQQTVGASTEYVIIESDQQTVDDPAFQEYVGELQAALAARTDIVAAPPASYYDVRQRSEDAAAGLVSASRTATLLPVEIKDDETVTVDELRAVLADHRSEAFTTQVAGQATLFADFSKIAEEDARKGEGIGMGVALIVLVVVFGAIVAALVPIAMAVAAIVLSLGLVSVIGQAVEFNLFVVNMISMIGLAVGIDYSLFIVSRYREERKKGFAKLDAIGASGATASRAVFFSGATVVLALLGMFILPTTIFRSLASGAIFVTLMSLLAAMTLLPALLALLGDRTDWPWMNRIGTALTFVGIVLATLVVAIVLAVVGVPAGIVAPAALAAIVVEAMFVTRLVRKARPGGLIQRARREVATGDPDPRGGFWDRITRSVMERPVVFLLAGVLVLGSLGIFALQLNKGSSTSIETFPDDVPSKAAFLTLQREFAGGLTEPAEIVLTGNVDAPEVQAAIRQLQRAVAQMPAFAPQTQVLPSPDGSAIRVQAFFQGTAQNDAAFDAIRELRDDVVPAAFQGVSGVDVSVGGNTAFFLDFLDLTDTYQWIVLAFVLGLSFLLLMVVFRSIVVPIKAIIMNLLSVAAAYGAITLVFQEGVGIGIFNAIGFNFQRTDAIEAWLPLFLFSVLFGLSMDYHVFLLSRIREEYDKTHDNTEAVAYGLRTTAGIITGAAIIMVTVFTAFASGRLGPFQQMGFGLAVAVFLDATIVRTILVPASMRLLGDLNWYLPKWLQWLPKLNVEGHEPERVVV
ncbi:MAG TPA: MMPL family transporter, partial [Actinomycetota bacterium]|nr:MMPL family transporter [Actinomycetota bacterium]